MRIVQSENKPFKQSFRTIPGQSVAKDKTGLKKAKKNKFDFYRTNAWKWCRRYVLLFYSDKNGIVKCATSGRLMQIGTRSCHCGHYIKVRDGNSTNYSTAFDFRNLAPQSMQDNTFMGGRQDIMRAWLVEKHGENNIKELEEKRKIICKLDNYILEYWENYYKEKYKQLLITKNVNSVWKI